MLAPLVPATLGTGEVNVQFDERLTSPEQLKSVVQHADYGVDTTNPAQAIKAKAAVVDDSCD